MRKHKRWTLALVVALVALVAMAGLVSAAGAHGRVLWASKCPVKGGEVVVNQVADTYEVFCVIGDKVTDD